MKRLVLFFLCLLSLSACSIVRVDSKDIASAFYPPKPGIDVAYIERAPARHTVIGHVTVATERAKPMDEILAQMKREAGILGGDAITDIREKSGNLWQRVRPQRLLGNAYVRAEFTATVIVYQ